MNEEIKKIREYIKCPQFGDIEYGKWGALNLEQRRAFKRLCDYIESSDNYITNLQQRIDKAVEYIEKYLHEHVIDEYPDEQSTFYDEKDRFIPNAKEILLNILKGEDTNE